jgi:hypothetical protein
MEARLPRCYIYIISIEKAANPNPDVLMMERAFHVFLSYIRSCESSVLRFNVRGAEANRVSLHLPAGPHLEERDQILRGWDWEDLDARSKWPYLDTAYAKDLMGFDARREAIAAFKAEFGGPSYRRNLG